MILQGLWNKIQFELLKFKLSYFILWVKEKLIRRDAEKVMVLVAMDEHLTCTVTNRPLDEVLYK